MVPTSGNGHSDTVDHRSRGYPRRVLLIGSDIARCATLLAASVLTLEQHLTTHVMWGVVCLTATFNLVFDASLGAFIPELLLPSQWLGANSRLSATGLVPGLAGYIVQALSAPVALYLNLGFLLGGQFCCT